MELLGHDFFLFRNTEIRQRGRAVPPARRRARPHRGRGLSRLVDVAGDERPDSRAGRRRPRAVPARPRAGARRASPTSRSSARPRDGLEAVERAAELAARRRAHGRAHAGRDGIEATRRIRTREPDVKIVMLTESEDEEDLFAAVRAGATGYLLKEVAIDEIADAVRAVAGGQALVSPSMTTKLLREFNVLSRRVEEDASTRRRAHRPRARSAAARRARACRTRTSRPSS